MALAAQGRVLIAAPVSVTTYAPGRARFTALQRAPHIVVWLVRLGVGLSALLGAVQTVTIIVAELARVLVTKAVPVRALWVAEVHATQAAQMDVVAPYWVIIAF